MTDPPIVGTTWCDKNQTDAIVIVKILGASLHLEDVVVRVLDLTTGDTRELIYDTKRRAFPWLKLREM